MTKKTKKFSMPAALAHLAKSDAVMKHLIKKHGHAKLFTRGRDPFNSLVTSIIGQQLSLQAARTIKARLNSLAGESFTPEKILSLTPRQLKATSLSQAKIKYIHGLARRVKKRQLDFEALNDKDDEDALATLIEIPGVGPWTAHMFLIFSLQRPNIMAFGDAGLQRAAKLLYGERGLHPDIVKLWQPYCSIASWYLWQHLDDK